MAYEKEGPDGTAIPDEHWSYIGDGVYAGFDGYGVWLHANDHRTPTDKVYLEPDVLEALNRFYARSLAAVRPPAEPSPPSDPEP